VRETENKGLRINPVRLYMKEINRRLKRINCSGGYGLAS
jgi:hypothetical protein